jgi:cell wall-associated NlpC family hydrolase
VKTLQERRHDAKLRKTRARNAARARVVRTVKAQIGDRYRHGAVGPSAFDCSGLAVYVYKHGAHKALPRTSYAQYAKLRHVSKRAMRPGDLVFFFRHGVHHVGIYIGHGKIVDAENPRRGVRTSALSNSWNRRHYSGSASMF